MSDALILNAVLFLPVFGTVLLLFVPPKKEDFVRGLSLGVMLAQLALTAWLYCRYDATVPGVQYETRLPWIPGWGVYYQIGLDGYNLSLIHI